MVVTGGLKISGCRLAFYTKDVHHMLLQPILEGGVVTISVKIEIEIAQQDGGRLRVLEEGEGEKAGKKGYAESMLSRSVEAADGSRGLCLVREHCGDNTPLFKGNGMGCESEVVIAKKKGTEGGPDGGFGAKGRVEDGDAARLR
jgi:hypothetical protein